MEEQYALTGNATIGSAVAFTDRENPLPVIDTISPIYEFMMDQLKGFVGRQVNKMTRDAIKNAIFAALSARIAHTSSDIELTRMEFDVEASGNTIKIIPRNLYTLLTMSDVDFCLADIANTNVYRADGYEYCMMGDEPVISLKPISKG